MALRWSTGRPTTPGIYLRCNPAVDLVLRQDVWHGVDGELMTSGADFAAVPVDGTNPVFLWFGPIAKPTAAQRDEALRRG